jgi:mannan endo-1,4-beta-mannosidase
MPFTGFFSQYQQKTQQQNAISSQFVTRIGNTLYLNRKEFRFAGANIHWLGMDDADNENYPSHSRIDNVFSAASAMHATVVRSHTLGISVGRSNSIEPQLNQFNDQAFESIDYAIKTAGAHNIHLIIPLIDNYYYYMGGRHTFINWRGLSDENQFYINPIVIQDFKNYISHILNHVNQYTGIALKDDPTIMAWETGNELFPPFEWTETIADYIKNLTPNQLIVDGRQGIDSASLPISSVDIYSDHFYPRDTQRLINDANEVAKQNKVFIVGEYDWTEISQYSWEASPHQSSPITDFLSAIEINKVAGDLFWELYDNGYTTDQFPVHYPGDNPFMQSRVKLLTDHAVKMSVTT